MKINIGDCILGITEEGKRRVIKVGCISKRDGRTIYSEGISHYINGHWKTHYIKIPAENVIGIYRCESCGRELVRQGKCYCEYCKTGKIKLYKINEPIKCDNPEF